MTWPVVVLFCRYLSERYFNKRIGVIIFEAAACIIAVVVLLLGVVDADSVNSDTTLFAVTFLLVRYVQNGMNTSDCVNYQWMQLCVCVLIVCEYGYWCVFVECPP